MKIFEVYAKVKLNQKPNWLDDFRFKYDEPFEYHVTLKQPCFIEEDKILDIKNKLNNLFLNLKIPNHEIALTFDSLKIPPYTPDVCIMINASNINEILKLQKNVLLVLSEYSQYCEIKTKEYEENFEPHITIAKNLDEQSYLLAAKELEQDYLCEGIVKEVVLVIVDNPNVVEASNPKNQTIFSL